VKRFAGDERLPRLVLITRGFWPLVGGAELVAARLAAAFQARGAATTVLTARWNRQWPAVIEHHGVRVVRLDHPRTRFYGTWRYMQAVGRWLRDNRAAFDLAYVSMLKHDAYAAVTAAQRAAFPVVLRAEGAGVTGDCFWQLEATCGARIKRRCLLADAFVAPSPTIERELIAAGYARERIHYLPNGVSLPETNDEAGRQRSRIALAEADPALKIGPDTPLAVYTGRLHEMKGLEYLVRAWPRVLERVPRARLWLVGDGPDRSRLNELIGALGLPGSVSLAGPFDDVEDCLRAANLFVLPSLEEGMSIALLEAMAMALPVVATAIAANEVLITDEVCGRLVPKGDCVALARTIADLLTAPAAATRLAEEAHRRVRTTYSLDRTVDAHLELFRRLVQPR
jgi:glycosyltransferase involved in cell wall biosynthesis